MKTLYRAFAFAVLFLVTTAVRAQQPALRGIYVNGFSSILGNAVKEDSLLRYAQDSSFNYLALYDLHSLNFGNSSTVNLLAGFVRRARQDYGITYIGAVGENWSFFSNRIAYYNNTRTDVNERFNVFNVEFEFWVPTKVGSGGYYCLQYLQQANCSCDTAGAFRYYIDLLRKVDSLAAASGTLSETYVGWFNQGQGQQIVQKADRILLHAYRVDPSTVFGYSRDRLSFLGSTSRIATVVPIFSAEQVFMGPWLSVNPQINAWNKYLLDYNNYSATWKSKIDLNGYQWFNYGLMPKAGASSSTAFAPVINANGPTSFCQGSNVTLTATSGSSYLWNNGATTRSITVNSAGSYQCTVTSNGTVANTPAVSVSVYASPYASVLVGSGTSNGVQLTSNVMAGSGTVAGYQWYLDNSALAGETYSDLVAVADGNYQVQVTNSNGCSIRSASVAVSVIAPVACNLTTPDAISTTDISMATALLNWQQVPYCDSLQLRIRVEGSNQYIYISLPYLGQTSYLLTGLAANQKYSWRLRTKCGNSVSNYSNRMYFRTTASGSGRVGQPVVEVRNLVEGLIAYPNPADDHLCLNIVAEEESNVIIQWTDAMGRIAHNETHYVIEGESKVSLSSSYLQNGLYVLSLIYPDQVMSTMVSIRH